MEKDADGEEDNSVSVDHVSPQRFFTGVGELQLYLRLLFFSQFRGIALIKATEPVVGLLTTAGFLTHLCRVKRQTETVVIGY